MTRTEAKILAPIITAFGEGKAIQAKHIRNDRWEDVNLLDLENNSDWEYRIKPEPREFWVNIYEDGDIFIHPSKEKALQNAGSKRIPQTIRLREVID